MVNSDLMISVSGVRGVVGQSMTAAIALRWAESFGSFCAPGPVIVGGDSRISKTMMRAATISGLAGAGSRVIDIGVVPTPTIQLAIEHHRARGGIAITASHNPAEWNALKFFNENGFFLDQDEGNALRMRVESTDSYSVDAFHVGSYERDDLAVSRHHQAVLKIPFLDIQKIRARKFRVGLDCVNGAGGELLTKLLAELNCEVIGYHLEPTGMFPRNPEPLPEHLADVCRAMKNANIDIGFVTDPDADRLAVIRSDGKPAGEELTLVAAADITLRYVKGPLVANCSTTRALDDIAAKYSVPLYRTKVGEAHVAKKMRDVNAVIGGEGNGGVMLSSVHASRDSAVGIALILQALLESGTSSAEYFDSLPHYSMVKKRRDFSSSNDAANALREIETKFAFGEPDKLDGLKWSKNSSWVQVRASNTEPIVRIFAEAPTHGEAESLATNVLKLLGTK